MTRFSVSRRIKARPEAIWSLLADAPGYPRWNSTVDKVVGRIAAGQAVTVHTKASPGRAFPVKVTAFDPPRRMVWKGGMPLRLFTGERTFTLRPEADGAVTFEMVEAYRGLLAPLIVRSIPDLQPAFEQFADDLKRLVEPG